MNDNIKVGICGCKHRCAPPTTYKTIILKPNCVCGHNTLTQEMLSEKNTKYVIKYDFTLGGERVIVPEECIFEFDGGSLRNGTIVGQDTVFINVGDVDIWGENLTREGTWREHSGGGGSEQIQSDWNQTDPTKKDFIKNKPQIPESDRPYDPENFKNMGKRYLEKNIVDGRNILTQEMINDPNIIYVVQYDFSLGDVEDKSITFDSSRVTTIKTPERIKYDTWISEHPDATEEQKAAEYAKVPQDYYYWAALDMQAGHAININGKSFRLNDTKTAEIARGTVLASDDTTIYIANYNGTYTYRYDSYLELPENSVLEFDGGNLANGTLAGKIQFNDADYKIFDNIEFAMNNSSLGVDFVRPEWFGAKGDFNHATNSGTDDSIAINTAMHAAMTTFTRRVKFRAVPYFVGDGITIETGHIILEGVYASTVWDDTRTNSSVQNTGELSKNERSALIGTGDYIIKVGTNATGPIIIRYLSIFYRLMVNGPKNIVGIEFNSESGGPLWPFIVEYCWFFGFNKAIEFRSANAYNVYDVDVHRCAFYYNNFLLYFDDTNTPPKTGATNMIPGGQNFTYGIKFTDNNCVYNTRTLYINAVMGVVKIQRNDFEQPRSTFNDGTVPTDNFSHSQCVLGVGSNVHVDFSDNYYEALEHLHPVTIHVYNFFSPKTRWPKFDFYNNHFWEYNSQYNDNYSIRILGETTEKMYPFDCLIVEKCQVPLHLYQNVVILAPNEIPDIKIMDKGTYLIMSNNLNFKKREKNNNVLYSYVPGPYPQQGGLKAYKNEVYWNCDNGAIPVFGYVPAIDTPNVYALVSMKYIDFVGDYTVKTLGGITNDISGKGSYRVLGQRVHDYSYCTVIRRFEDYPNLNQYIAPVTQDPDCLFYVSDAKLIEDDGDKYIGELGIVDYKNRQIPTVKRSVITGMVKGEVYISGDDFGVGVPVIWDGSNFRITDIYGVDVPRHWMSSHPDVNLTDADDCTDVTVYYIPTEESDIQNLQNLPSGLTEFFRLNTERMGSGYIQKIITRSGDMYVRAKYADTAWSSWKKCTE